MKSFTVEEKYVDTRLDKYIRKRYENLNLSVIFKYIRLGKIKVNKKKVKQNYRLQAGDVIQVFLSEDVTREKAFLEVNEIRKKELKERIVYEDDNILIYNKPANEVMHKGTGYDYGVSEEFKGYFKTNDFTFVNRIDKSTSGLIIGSKNLKTTRYLSEVIKEKQVTKKYYILVDGKVEEDNFTLESYLTKEEKGVVERNHYTTGAKKSISHFKSINRGSKYSLLEGYLETGRTHQLRVQLANLGHPIVGDPRYGKAGKKMYLFSYYLNIPSLNKEFKLPLPKEFEEKISKSK